MVGWLVDCRAVACGTCLIYSRLQMWRNILLNCNLVVVRTCDNASAAGCPQHGWSMSQPTPIVGRVHLAVEHLAKKKNSQDSTPNRKKMHFNHTTRNCGRDQEHHRMYPILPDDAMCVCRSNDGFCFWAECTVHANRQHGDDDDKKKTVRMAWPICYRFAKR